MSTVPEDNSDDGLFSDMENAGVKVLLTVIILICIVSCSLGFAWLCRYCRKKNLLPEDDESAISEHTRSILRARLAVLQYKKKEMRREKRARTLLYVSRRLTFARNKKIDHEEDDHDVAKVSIDKVHSLAKIKNGSDNDSASANAGKDGGTAGMARLPIFKHSGGESRPPEVPENSNQTVKTQSKTAESPVPRGRPVSSKSHVLSNVNVTSADVNCKPKLHLKSVHFDDESRVKQEVTHNTDSKAAKTEGNNLNHDENLLKNKEQTQSHSIANKANGGSTNHGFSNDVNSNSSSPKINVGMASSTVTEVNETKT